MKILFAVNNDNISEAIVKKYQKEYREILSYKNVYYFNAILRELQKDKSYSRIVISEDLEPFANNNNELIDKFLLEKYNIISEEAKDINNDKIDIILICADRRKKTDNLLAKIYKKGIYNAITGQDRSIDEICRLINRPRDKEGARMYYGIPESELAETESENSVSEAEVENIRAHYARLGKNEDKYIESFNNIVAQYTDNQLKIIIKYLPINVKAVLEEKSPKYQQLALETNVRRFDAKKKTANYKEQIKEIKPQKDDLVEQLIKPKNIKSVVIPTNLTTKNVQKVVIPKIEINKNISLDTDNKAEIEKIEENKVDENLQEAQQPKRGRGRPRKNPIVQEQEEKPKRGRGRPRKNPVEMQQDIKSDYKEADLFNISEENKEQEVDLFNINEENKEQEVDLFNINEENKEQEVDLFNINEENKEQEVLETSDEETTSQEQDNTQIINTRNSSSTFNQILTVDKKIVAFVGTTKNGTSFIVNNTAEMLSSMGIETAILDLTKTKNAYYIYTNNDESLRNISKKCMGNLQNGIAEGIKVNKKLTVYTEMPGEENEYEIETIFTTLLNKYSVVLIDSDFDTDPKVFEKVQEIYLVQTMDVLTIQPLTAFLRNLKSKGILRPEILKIVINKSERVRSLSIKTLIGGMSCYNSPSMSYMTELFNRENIPYCEIPFEVQNYVKYLDSLVNCSISLNGYTKTFINSLKKLTNMVYPLVNKQINNNQGQKREPFSNQINDTLNKMKKRY